MLANDGGQDSRATVWVTPDGCGELAERVEGIEGSTEQRCELAIDVGLRLGRQLLRLGSEALRNVSSVCLCGEARCDVSGVGFVARLVVALAEFAFVTRPVVTSAEFHFVARLVVTSATFAFVASFVVTSASS